MGCFLSSLKWRLNQFGVARKQSLAVVGASQGWMPWEGGWRFDEGLNHPSVSNAVPPVSVVQAAHHAVPRVFVPCYGVGLAPGHHTLVPVPRPQETRFFVAVQAGEWRAGVELVEDFRWASDVNLHRPAHGADLVQQGACVGEVPCKMKHGLVRLLHALKFHHVQQHNVFLACKGFCEWGVVRYPEVVLEPDHPHTLQCACFSQEPLCNGRWIPVALRKKNAGNNSIERMIQFNLFVDTV